MWFKGTSPIPHLECMNKQRGCDPETHILRLGKLEIQKDAPTCWTEWQLAYPAGSFTVQSTKVINLSRGYVHTLDRFHESREG